MTKRNIRRWLFAAVVGGGLIAAGVVALIAVEGNSASALPNPNGYDDLLAAGQAVVGKSADFSELDHEVLRALVATNAEALRLLRIGLARRCAVPTDAQIANPAAPNRDLIGLKSVAWVLSAEGRLAEMENRPADAARSYVDAIRLGNEMSHGGLLINRLVGIACEGAGSIPLVKLLPKLNCEQMQALAVELEKIDEGTVAWREVLQNENRFLRDRVGGYRNPIKLASDFWEARHMRRAAKERHDLAAAHLRLLAAELALRAYRCGQGQGPRNLLQLVPKYLPHLPTDPFSDKPLVYRPNGTNWMLYSLGPDRVDDDGKPVGKIISGDFLIAFGESRSGEGQNKGDLLYDSGW